MTMKAIFVFYNVATGVPALFTFHKHYRHMSVITSHDDYWVNYDCGGKGIHYDIVQEPRSTEEVMEGLKQLSYISGLVSIEYNEADRAFVSWKPFIIRSCNELCRYLTGIDIGLTWNPYHFHKKLFKHAKDRNYVVTAMWERLKDKESTYGNVRKRQWSR